MTVKEYLKQAERLNDKIQADEAELEQLRELTDSVKGLILGERVQMAPKNSLEETVIKIVDLENKINIEISKLVGLKEDIRDLVDKLEDDTEKLILQKRYLLFEDWGTIANDLNYSYRHLTRLHGKILLKLKDVL